MAGSKWLVGVIWCAVLVALVCASGDAGASSWSNSEVRLASKSMLQQVTPDSVACYGMVTNVLIRSTGEVRACVMGGAGEARLARYIGANYQYAYAFAVEGQAQYVRIDALCSSLRWCAYSPATDTLLLESWTGGYRYGHKIVSDFTKQISYYAFPEPHYQFAHDESLPFISAGTQALNTGAVAVSQNGHWAAIELLGYGFVRVDMRTGEYRRVVAPGAVYGHGVDPSFELAISNSGRQLAVVGFRAGVDVYELDGLCGDKLSESSQTHFGYGTVACRVSSIERQILFPDFLSAHVPRFSSDGQALSLQVKTMSGIYAGTLTPLPPGSTHDRSLYVAFGDSFVSGEGELDDTRYLPHTNTSTNRCHVSTRSYPFLLTSFLNADVHSRACSGSRTQEVRALLQHELGQGAALWPAYASLGIGGNDIDVMGKLKSCLLSDTCAWALPEYRPRTAQEIRMLYPKLVALLSDMRSNYSAAAHFVVGYPKVINDAEQAPCDPLLARLLNYQERRYMNETIAYLNQVLEAAALEAGAQFVDVSNAYGQERLCDQTPAAMNGFRVGDDVAPLAPLGAIKVIGAESFHPTPRGHALVAQAIRDSLTLYGDAPRCEFCGGGALPAPASYWEWDESSDGIRIAPYPLSAVHEMVRGSIVTLSAPDGTFVPESEVVVELYSERTELGRFATTKEGGFRASVRIPEVEGGYHTIFVMGQDEADMAVQLYQSVYIAEKESTSAGGRQAGVGLQGGYANGAVVQRRTEAAAADAKEPFAGVEPFTPQAVLGKQNFNRTTAAVVQEVSSVGVTLVWWMCLGLVVILVTVTVLFYAMRQRRV